jgi:hypothetical protein
MNGACEEDAGGSHADAVSRVMLNSFATGGIHERGYSTTEAARTTGSVTVE